ncbi:MAG TPA: cytidylate kinase-like family protein, partial [Tepidisphaeraceae bacterium]|nr:cytidylate kinase-like family protein [Tepidisphaeraceae bacterium]
MTHASAGIRPILAAIRTVPIPPKYPLDQIHPNSPTRPFITISREPGAGGLTLGKALAEALTAADPNQGAWTCWDRELVEKVAADYHLSRNMVESLEETRHSWLADLLESLSFSDQAPTTDEATIYARVSETIRALARAGRVIIVGRGGVFVTRRMPGGIHVRLVAPLEYRVAFMAKLLNVSSEAAAAYVKEADHNRRAFFERHWPGESLKAEAFTITM